MIDETVAISFENWNRNDEWLNTWTQVTDIRVWEPYQLFLPQLTGGSVNVQAAAPEETPVLHNNSSAFAASMR